MGCFLHCFGSSKNAKRRKHSPKRNACGSSPEQPTVSCITASQVQAEPEEQLNGSTRKKVTFDSNVKTYEPVVSDEVADFQPEKCEGGREEVEALVKSTQSVPCSEDSSVTSTRSYPTNHRYHNCQDSDNEDGEMDCWDSDLTYDEDEDEDGDCDMGEENGEMREYFENEVVCSWARNAADQVVAEEVESGIPACHRNVNPNARDRSVYVHPVLNPVENLTQWKAVKGKRTPPPLRSQKENCLSSQESQVAFGAEPTFKELSFSSKLETYPLKKSKQEIAVDASLSNWLVSSETTPVNKSSLVALYADTPKRSSSNGSNSVISQEDRPILGALTVEELKQFSASSSPSKSPSRNPDEMPIIGTVGTYWAFSGSSEDSGSVISFRGITQEAGTGEVLVK